MHLSDAGFPRTLPDSNGYFLVKYYQQISPEQGKYTTSLDMSYADVTRLDELYMYLPSARRPIRMSQASRCSPVPGSDFTYEESNNGPPSLPQEYKITYAGTRRMVVLAHADPKVFESCGGASSLPSDYFYPADGAAVAAAGARQVGDARDVRDRDEQAARLCEWLLLQSPGDLRRQRNAFPSGY
jgi:hypothetical protein